MSLLNAQMLPQDLFSQADNMTVSTDLHSLGKRKEGEAEGWHTVACSHQLLSPDRVKKDHIAQYGRQPKIKYYLRKII